MIIIEGMRPRDLEDLVLPMITVDEYESKLDDDAVVFGFYVGDKDAAGDLNRFLQKSPMQILDTEVSPAPDQHGYYLVFIEMMNDKNLVKNIKSILDEVSPLTGNDSWQMRLRGHDGVIPFNAKLLGKRFAELRQDLDHDDADETERRVIEFFTASDLKSLSVENRNLVLTGHDASFRGEIIALDSEENLLLRHGLNESAMSLDLKDIAESLKLTRLLGEGWLSSHFNDFTVLQRVGSDSSLLLRNASFG
jgi:hypothetical protein